MGDDERDLPELATNADWRGIMKRARASHDKMSQGELASRVRRLLKSDEPSQAMISKIESGASTTSTYIKPICQVLGIALPEHFVDEDDRAWVQLGRVLRSQSMEKFKRQLATVGDLVAQPHPAPPAEPHAERNAKPQEPSKPKRERRPPQPK